MVETYQRRSALAHFGLAAVTSQKADAGITVGEIAHRAILNIRGNAGDLVFSAAVKAATGVDLPPAPNTVSAADDVRILWLGPNEWWVVAPDAKRTALLESLQQSFAGQHAAVIDVSESRTVI